MTTANLVQEELFTDTILLDEKRHGEPPPKVKIPKNDQILFYTLFFLMGICHFLPITFFSAANNYWLYKFRNIDDETNSAANRTSLQRNFGSASTIASTVPVLAVGFFNVAYAHKFKIVNRLLLTFGIVFVIFVLFTVCAVINTDEYQLVFFFVIMILFATMAGANTINLVACMNLYPRFPHTFMKIALIGEGCSGIIGSTLNIIIVAIFTDNILTATFLYFVCGSFVVGLTLLLTFCVSRRSTFNDCLNSFPEDVKKKKPSKEELSSVFKKLWFVFLILGVAFVGMSATHPSITSLVVSELNPEESSWATNYFSPVMTFLLSDVSLLFGRLASSYIPIDIPDRILFIIVILRTIFLIPGIWLCNAQPRKHLPILFPHDYQYGLISSISMFTMGYFINMGALHIAKNVDKEEADTAYALFGLAMTVIQTVTSPIGIFIVNVI